MYVGSVSAASTLKVFPPLAKNLYRADANHILAYFESSCSGTNRHSCKQLGDAKEIRYFNESFPFTHLADSRFKNIWD